MIFGTVVVRRRNNWMKRVSAFVLPNASLIRVLALDLAFTQEFTRGQHSDDELELIRQLLGASTRVSHLAATWNIWAHLDHECGALQLESLYLIWDGAFHRFEGPRGIHPPSLQHLQHPAALKDLTVYAPPDIVNGPKPQWRIYGGCCFPDTSHCPNITYETYAAPHIPWPFMLRSRTRTMFVCVGYTEDGLISQTAIFPHIQMACVRSWSQVLDEWLAKMEGKPSVLDHPPHEKPCG